MNYLLYAQLQRDSRDRAMRTARALHTVDKAACRAAVEVARLANQKMVNLLKASKYYKPTNGTK